MLILIPSLCCCENPVHDEDEYDLRNITRTTSTSELNSSLCINGSGEIVLAYQSGPMNTATSEYQILISHSSDGSGWSTAEAITANDRNSISPRCISLYDGNIAIAYTELDSIGSRIFYTNGFASAWSESVPLSDYHPTYPQITQSLNGTLSISGSGGFFCQVKSNNILIPTYNPDYTVNPHVVAVS
jgi:hypothetical protein